MRIFRTILILVLLSIVIFSGCVGKSDNAQNNTQNTQNVQKTETKNTTQVSVGSIIPDSLGKYYTTTPSEYLTKMYELAESMQSIRVNINQNASKDVIDNSIEQFTKDYNDSYNMVPEWTYYYDLDTAQKLSTDNDAQILDDLDSIYSSCTDCHREMKPAVWAKYNWKDFRDIQINTPFGLENWSVGKILLEDGLDGIDINIKQGDKNNITASYNSFKSVYTNMIDVCKNCHNDTNLKYNDLDLVNNLEKDINSGISSGDFSQVNNTRQQIINNCYNCHIIHETYQRIKEIDEPR